MMETQRFLETYTREPASLEFPLKIFLGLPEIAALQVNGEDL